MVLKKWLCLGKKKDHSDKCIYAKIEIKEFERPIFASSEKMVKYKGLSIFCKKRMRYVRLYVTSCSDFQTNTLGDF